MAEFVADCPRCGVRVVTFTVKGDSAARNSSGAYEIELLGQCRNCSKCSIGVFVFTASFSSNYVSQGFFTRELQGSVNSILTQTKFVSVSDRMTIIPPQHLPPPVLNCFQEGAAAFAIGANNAAAAMFRLALDIATKGLLPSETADQGGPNANQRKRLYDRLEYLFDKNILASDLRDLADCVREDGNDGAHDGTLTKADAEDLIDFTEQLLERTYTEPARLREAKARRDARRAG